MTRSQVRAHLAALVLVLSIRTAEAADQPLCMSDDELQAYVIAMWMSGAIQGTDTCCPEGSDCRPAFGKVASVFARKYGLAIRPFERAYGSAGESRFFDSMRAYVASTGEANLNEDQCPNYMKGVDAMVSVESEWLEKSAKPWMEYQRRQGMPRCGQ